VGRIKPSLPPLTTAEFNAALKEAGFGVERARIVDTSGQCPGFVTTAAFRGRALDRPRTLAKAIRDREAEIGLRRRPGGRAAEMGHVWTAPGWHHVSRAWSEQPCVRPVSAVHMTAGHNALRGSGPGQKHAFDNALAQVGCPDRRVDRLCITCCSPFPTVHITPRARRDLVHAASATGSL
jgi:hypothetical protein